MPISFEPQNTLELVKYGIFRKLHQPGTVITADEAVSISEDDTSGWTTQFTREPPALTITLDISEIAKSLGRKNWAVIVSRYNWGMTSRPDKIYYELWSYGPVVSPRAYEGFTAGAKLGMSDVDNQTTHPVADSKVEWRVWNCSEPAEDVWVELTVWYYIFQRMYTNRLAALNVSKNSEAMLENLNKMSLSLEKIGEGLKVEVL